LALIARGLPPEESWVIVFDEALLMYPNPLRMVPPPSRGTVRCRYLLG